jgi:hypothetical protein
MNYVNLTGIRGDSTTFNFSLNDCNGVPLNLSGAELTMTIGYGSFQVLQKNIVDHVIPESGITYVQISGNDWDNIPNGTFDYDVQITDYYNQISTVMRGLFYIEEDVTR